MTHTQRLTLVAAILGSSVVALDATVVNVALPAIRDELGGGLQTQQWIANAYLLTLGALILTGGSLGDILGRRRIFAIGEGGLQTAMAHGFSSPAALSSPRRESLCSCESTFTRRSSARCSRRSSSSRSGLPPQLRR